MKAFKQWLDRKAISVATRALPPVRANLARDEEALRLIAADDFLRPLAQSADVKIREDGSFHSHSTAPTGANVLDSVFGKIWLVKRDAPTVILVHGWNAELHYLYGFPRLARALNCRGLNAIAFELPYHLQRRPKRPAEIRDFISDSLASMLLGTRQAIADTEALALWAKGQGSPRVALWGFSLGAWLAGLHITQSATVDSTVLTTPVSDLKLAVETLSFCFPIRAALEHTPAPVERLNLTAYNPSIRPQNILVTEAVYDQFVPQRTYPELARAWNLPAWQKLPQSHISILASRVSMASAADWLHEHLKPQSTP